MQMQGAKMLSPGDGGTRGTVVGCMHESDGRATLYGRGDSSSSSSDRRTDADDEDGKGDGDYSLR